MAEVVYMIMVFFAPISEAPFDVGLNTRTYTSLEACLAAIPNELDNEVPASLRDAVEGVACVEPDMADTIMDTMRATR